MTIAPVGPAMFSGQRLMEQAHQHLDQTVREAASHGLDAFPKAAAMMASARHMHAAGAALIETADDMIGAVIDILV